MKKSFYTVIHNFQENTMNVITKITQPSRKKARFALLATLLFAKASYGMGDDDTLRKMKEALEASKASRAKEQSITTDANPATQKVPKNSIAGLLERGHIATQVQKFPTRLFFGPNRLDLEKAEELTDLNGLDKIPNIEEVALINARNRGITQIDPQIFPKMPKLEKIVLHAGYKLTDAQKATLLNEIKKTTGSNKVTIDWSYDWTRVDAKKAAADRLRETIRDIQENTLDKLGNLPAATNNAQDKEFAQAAAKLKTAVQKAQKALDSGAGATKLTEATEELGLEFFEFLGKSASYVYAK